jgi:small subunit ribosomal protein S6
MASSVSDDQQPEVAGQITKFVEDFGGTDIQDTQLGKKKLAYPVKKTRNGFYGVVDFVMDATKINDLDAKIRTQDSTIIRYIIVNMDEHYERLAKDREVQAKMNRRPPEAEKAEGEETGDKPLRSEAPAEITEADLEQQIEKALSEDITK